MTKDPQLLPEGLESLPRLDETQIRLVWHFDWWDGPLNGLAEYDDQKAWFAFHDIDEPGIHYFYRLYLLTDAQVAEAELWRATRGDWNQESGHGSGEMSPATMPIGPPPSTHSATNRLVLRWVQLKLLWYRSPP